MARRQEQDAFASSLISDAGRVWPVESCTTATSWIQGFSSKYVMQTEKQSTGVGVFLFGLYPPDNIRCAVFVARLFVASTRCVADPMSGFYIFRRRVIDNADLQPTGRKTLRVSFNSAYFGSIS